MMDINSFRQSRPVRILGSCFAIALILVWIWFGSQPGPVEPGLAQSDPASAQSESEAVSIPPQPVQKTVYDRPIPARSSLHDVLIASGLGATQIHEVIQEVKPVYNLARVRAGNRLRVRSFQDGSLSALEYEIDEEEYLVVRREGDIYRAERRLKEFQTRQVSVRGEISGSLWESLIAIGESQGLVMSMADVFQWDVDFSAVQPRDSFSLVVEKKFLDGTFIKYGNILAARFETGGKGFQAFLFEDPDSGRKIYYDDRGKAVRKAFLKAPFHFNPRISSRFSHRRFHPVLKIWRPHFGVDYAAPQGTPVLSSAAGRVVFAGWKGGYGRLVRVRHSNGYTTGYAHLSKISVRRGQRVVQGEGLGRVGATGLATGAHLDYRVQDPSGRFINPRKMVSLPSDKPVSNRNLKDFMAVRDAFLRRLAGLRMAGCEDENWWFAD